MAPPASSAAKRTARRMKPNSVFVRMPATVAARYDDHRRSPARASARYAIATLLRQTDPDARRDPDARPGWGVESVTPQHCEPASNSPREWRCHRTDPTPVRAVRAAARAAPRGGQRRSHGLSFLE